MTRRKGSTSEPSALAVLAAISNNPDGWESPLDALRSADRALAALVAYEGGAWLGLADACDALNRHADSPDYLKHVAAHAEAAAGLTAAVADNADMLRYYDREAAFALGLAAGLRLAGGGR